MFRFLHRFYAWAFGYFWLPCPVCGEMFGGHECSRESVRLGNRNMVVCRKPCCEQFAMRDWDRFVQETLVSMHEVRSADPHTESKREGVEL